MTMPGAEPSERQVVLVDGGSGSGKTTFAHALAHRMRGAGRRVQVVSLDDLYPGWHGLAAASAMVVDDVLGRGGYRRWDWHAGRPAEWVALDPDADLVVEGCGALTPASAALATRRIWLELDAETRRRRALGRADGDDFRPWWDIWADQEAEHWHAHQPWRLADTIMSTTAARQPSDS